MSCFSFFVLPIGSFQKTGNNRYKIKTSGLECQYSRKPRATTRRHRSIWHVTVTIPKITWCLPNRVSTGAVPVFPCVYMSACTSTPALHSPIRMFSDTYQQMLGSRFFSLFLYFFQAFLFLFFYLYLFFRAFVPLDIRPFFSLQVWETGQTWGSNNKKMAILGANCLSWKNSESKICIRTVPL